MPEIVDFIQGQTMFPKNIVVLSDCKKYMHVNYDHPMFEFTHKKSQVQQLIKHLQEIHDQMVD